MERTGDLPIGGPAGDEDQHLDLSRRESSRSASALALALPGGGKDGFYRGGVELGHAGIGSQFCGGLLGTQGRAIRPWLGHRAESTGRGEEPTSGRDGRSSQASVIAGAVAALVR